MRRALRVMAIVAGCLACGVGCARCVDDPSGSAPTTNAPQSGLAKPKPEYLQVPEGMFTNEAGAADASRAE